MGSLSTNGPLVSVSVHSVPVNAFSSATMKLYVDDQGPYSGPPRWSVAEPALGMPISPTRLGADRAGGNARGADLAERPHHLAVAHNDVARELAEQARTARQQFDRPRVGAST